MHKLPLFCTLWLVSTTSSSVPPYPETVERERERERLFVALLCVCLFVCLFVCLCEVTSMVGMNIASFNDVGSSSSTALYTRDRERE